MKDFLCATAIIVIFGVLVSGYPSIEVESPEPVAEDIVVPNGIALEYVEVEPPQYNRNRRSPNAQKQQKPLKFEPPQKPYDGTQINGYGSHSSSGTDVNLQAQQRLWRNNNRNHEIGAHGNYGQHFGGPSGNSRPSLGGGLGYTYHF